MLNSLLQPGLKPASKPELKPRLNCVVQSVTLNTEMLLEAALALASRPLPGLNAANAGPLPPGSASGEPGTWFSTPDGETEKTERLLSPGLAVVSSSPLGLNCAD